MLTVLFDDSRWEHLLPLTFTRPVSLIRVGITSIKEKWELALNTSCYFLTTDYLQTKYPLPPENEACLMVNAGVIPSPELSEEVLKLDFNEALTSEGTLIAVRVRALQSAGFSSNPIDYKLSKNPKSKPTEIRFPWDIFQLNGEILTQDFNALTKNRESEPVPESNTVLNPNKVFIEKGATVECSILNANTGPIYIGSEAEIMEGCMVRGPLAQCEHSALKMGAKIYGPTTIGPYCKVGGEVNNSVLQGFSNKAHDGFLGNSVIGEWCNIGADTNSSNLKNNYALVKLWSYATKRFVNTGLQFCGLIMGDHSKCGINTMFNTGTVVGICANIYGDGFPRNYIPNFSMGGAQGFAENKLANVRDTTRMVMARRGIELTQVDESILTHLYNQK